MGGNAVVGYRQQFDIEGDSGLVARAIGTVVTLADRGEEARCAAEMYTLVEWPALSVLFTTLP